MNSAERRVVGALWSLQGIGPKSIASIEAMYSLSDLLNLPTRRWAPAVDLPSSARSALQDLPSLAKAADELEIRARDAGQTIVFPGDAAWPSRLDDLPAHPRVLFMVGPGNAAAPKRRVGLVGTRHAEPAANARVRGFARELVAAGLGVVSGAAEGIDQAAHFGALEAHGETWAFLGSGIDQIDPAQQTVAEPLLKGGGTLFSHYPPGARADVSTFSRRNYLISGASDATVVARAPLRSGALQTAKSALDQGRPLLAIPGDPWNKAAQGSNALLRGGAKVCVSVHDVLVAVGLKTTFSPSVVQAPETPVIAITDLSPPAQRVLEELTRHACDTDELEAKVRLAPGQVSAALLELEVEGFALQRGGGLWEKV